MRKKTNLEQSISVPGTSPKKKKKNPCYFSSQMRYATIRNTIAYNDEWTVYCLYQAYARFLEQYEAEHTVRCPKWCSHHWSLSNESSFVYYLSAISVYTVVKVFSITAGKKRKLDDGKKKII